METVPEDKYTFSKFYENQNFTLNYKRFLYNYFNDEEEFVSFGLHQIFKDGTFQGKRLLDIGCGPTVHKVAAASAYFSEIVLSEYSQYNREEIKKWLRNESSSTDWDPLLRKTAVLEGYGNIEEGLDEIKLRLKEKIKEVIPCDILKKEIFPVDVGKFDALMTCYCLEGACTTLDAFKSAVNNFSNYILPNGELVMATVLDCPSYQVESKELPSLSVSQQFVNKTLKEAGFTKKHCFLIENCKENPYVNFSGVLVLSARREI